MDEKTINSYLDLINIKTLNGYYKYLFKGFGIILLTSLLEFGIPADILVNNSLLIESSLMLFNIGTITLLVNNKYRKNKKEFIKNNDIDVNTTVKECYEILQNEEIITKDMPVDNIISRYYLSPDNYYTEKGKKLVRKR